VPDPALLWLGVALIVTVLVLFFADTAPFRLSPMDAWGIMLVLSGLVLAGYIIFRKKLYIRGVGIWH
jgi:hypothetical protein